MAYVYKRGMFPLFSGSSSLTDAPRGTPFAQTGSCTVYAFICSCSPSTDPTFTHSRKERVQFDKVRVFPKFPTRHANSVTPQITARIQKLCYGLDTEHVDSIA